MTTRIRRRPPIHQKWAQLLICGFLVCLFPLNASALTGSDRCSVRGVGSLASQPEACRSIFIGIVEDLGGDGIRARVRIISFNGGIRADPSAAALGQVILAPGTGRLKITQGQRVAICFTQMKTGEWLVSSILHTEGYGHSSCSLTLYEKWISGLKRLRSATNEAEATQAYVDIFDAAEIAEQVGVGFPLVTGTILPQGEILFPKLLNYVKHGKMSLDKLASTPLSWRQNNERDIMLGAGWLDLLETDEASQACFAYKVLSTLAGPSILQRDDLIERCPTPGEIEEMRQFWKGRLSDLKKSQ